MRITTPLGFVSFALLASTGLAGAASAVDLDGPATPAAIFEVTDLNHNQKIDLDEFQARQSDVFFFTDADKNGFLTAAELGARGAEAIADVDHDKSASIDMSEFLELRTRAFLAADSNDDGNLTLQEVASGSR